MKSNVAAIKRAIRRGAKIGMEDIGDRIVELAIGFCPVARDGGGNLQRSIDHDTPRFDRDSIIMTYGAYAPYAAAVEYGTASKGEPVGSSYHSPVGGSGDWPTTPPNKKTDQPYKIRPKTRKALRWKDANGVHFRKEVTHPGVTARPFMRPAVDIVRHREASKIFGRSIEKELRSALGGS